MHWISPEMLHLPIPIVEKIIRTILVYASLVVLLRVFGKRELAQLNPFDLVVLLTLSNTVQNAIIGNDNSLVGGLIGAGTLLVVNYLVVRFLLQHRRLGEILEDSPTVLIDNGKVLLKNLARELMSESELRTVAHRQGYELADVQQCILEPSGTFAIKPKEPKRDTKKQWSEMIAKLDAIQAKLNALEGRMPPDARTGTGN